MLHVVFQRMIPSSTLLQFLPALAGVGGGGSRSFQIVNIGRGQVDNTVDFQPPIGPELHILVKGSVGRSAVDPGVRAEVKSMAPLTSHVHMLAAFPAGNRPQPEGDGRGRLHNPSCHLRSLYVPAASTTENCPQPGGLDFASHLVIE